MAQCLAVIPMGVQSKLFMAAITYQTLSTKETYECRTGSTGNLFHLVRFAPDISQLRLLSNNTREWTDAWGLWFSQSVWYHILPMLL